MDSIFETLMKNSAICVSDLQKCKNEIRALKPNKKRSDTCELNDAFRKSANVAVEFVASNQAKLTAMLQGPLDKAPMDLGEHNFYEKMSFYSVFQEKCRFSSFWQAAGVPNWRKF